MTTSTTFVIFLIFYGIISVKAIITYLGENNGKGAFMAVTYMLPLVWSAICVLANKYATGLLWYIAIQNIILLSLIMLAKAFVKKETKEIEATKEGNRNLTIWILVRLAVVGLAIGLALL